MPSAAPVIAFPLTASMAATAVAAFAIPALTQFFSIDLLQPNSIEFQQILGCHLLHWSAEHLFWDIGMFCVLGGLCERCWPKHYYATVALSAVTIPWLVFLFQPEISSYRGLSGIDTALFTLLATKILIDRLRCNDRKLALLFGGLLVALAGKVAYEFLTADLLFVSELNFVPLPLAHLAGGIIGAFVSVAALAGQRQVCERFER